MNEFFNKALTWVKSNMILAIGLLLVTIVLFFPKLLGGLFRKPRVRHRPGYYALRSGRTLPRSVGTGRRRRNVVTKSGRVKKPWQVKGSEAARRHMAKLRRMR